MGRPKHQHVTAKMHLRGFADRDGFVTVRRRSGQERDLHISNVAVRSGFYDFDTPTGHTSDGVERWLAEHVESPAGPGLTKLREGSVGAGVDATDVPALALFVATSLLRTPAVRTFMASVDADVGPMMLANVVLGRLFDDSSRVTEHDKALVLDEARRAWADRDQAEARRSQLRTVSREADRLAMRLAGYQWVVLHSEEPVLITSDAPVSALHLPGEPWRGAVPAGSPVFLPVSPQRLLLAEPHSLVRAHGLEPELVALVNQETTRHATDQIIKHPTQSWPPNLHLAPAPPVPPQPTVTWRRSDGPATFPARYPEVTCAQIRQLLDELGATDVVE